MTSPEGVEWRIYYSDGSTFDSRDGLPSDAPALRVQVIAQADASVGRVLVQNGDYYWYFDGSWFGGDIAGVYNYLIVSGILDPETVFESPIAMLRWMTGTGCVKLGEMLRAQDFIEIYHRAYDDPDLPTKSAFHRLEKKVVE